MLYVLRLIIISITLVVFIRPVESKEAFIGMPSPCYSVEEIKDNKVYLKADEKACAQVIQRTLISVDDSVSRVEIFVKGKLWQAQDLNRKDIDLDKIANLVEEQKKRLEAGKIVNDINNDEAAKRAGEATKNFYSEKYQSILNKEMERIKAETFNSTAAEKQVLYPDAVRKTDQHVLNQNSYVYIFISSSMPQGTIRTYIQDISFLKEQNIIIVLRGMIGEPAKIQETARYIKKLIQKDPDCQGKCNVYKVRFAIDPILYENYGITTVPSFIYDRKVKYEEAGRKKEIKNENEYYKLTGDVSLEYALEIIRREEKGKELEYLVGKFKIEYGTKN